MTNTFDDKLQQLDNKLRELRKELEDDLLKYKYKAMDELTKQAQELNMGYDTVERCSCGIRQKSKCVKENGMNSGKMCLREDEE